MPGIAPNFYVDQNDVPRIYSKETQLSYAEASTTQQLHEVHVHLLQDIPTHHVHFDIVGL